MGNSEQKKKEKRDYKPSTRKVMLYCESCDCSSEHFLTNIEIFKKIPRQVGARFVIK